MSHALFLALCLALAPKAAAQAEKSAKAPWSSVTAQSYQKQVLDAHKGRAFVVHFWASNCSSCLEELPHLLALQKEYRGQVDIVFVSADDPSDIARAQSILMRRQLRVDGFLMTDPNPEPFIAMVESTWSGEIPYSVVYNADGVATSKVLGSHREEEWRALLQSLSPLRKAP